LETVPEEIVAAARHSFDFLRSVSHRAAADGLPERARAHSVALSAGGLWRVVDLAGFFGAGFFGLVCSARTDGTPTDTPV